MPSPGQEAKAVWLKLGLECFKNHILWSLIKHKLPPTLSKSKFLYNENTATVSIKKFTYKWTPAVQAHVVQGWVVV